MSDTTVTVVGNTTRDIEIKFTNSGQAVGDFGIAVNKRVKGANGEWEDGEPEFYDVTLWVPRRALRGVLPSWNPGTRGRTAPVRHLGERGRREAIQGEDRGRSRRPGAALGDRRRDQGGEGRRGQARLAPEACTGLRSQRRTF